MNYSVYVVEDIDTGDWLHIGKQLGQNARSRPLIEAIDGKYPRGFHNKSLLMYLYSKNRNVEVKIDSTYATDADALQAERRMKNDPRARYAYRGDRNARLTEIELNRYLKGRPISCPTTQFLISQAIVHGDVFGNTRTPYELLPEEFKCLFKI